MMKKSLVACIVLCFMGSSVFSQGIDFVKGSWKEVLELAKKERKNIFVDCYTDWCRPCKEMEKEVFAVKKVGAYFNEHFISVKMDMESIEGRILLNMYKINAFPTFLFVNPDGGEIHRIVGKQTEKSFLQMGTDALKSQQVYPVSREAMQQIEVIGKEAPDFCYISAKGEKVALSSLRGKYVYIDFWATWCRPCCEEIPYMAELEKRFHGKNICFVSISCDRDTNAWKKKIFTDQMGGIQLNAGGDASFMDFFSIRGIPHFVLLDGEGKVVNPNMPRPSQEATIEMLEHLDGIDK